MMTEQHGARSSLHSADFTFLSKREYLAELITHLPKTVRGDRVLLVTHDLDPRQLPISMIVDELAAAAKRGVEATLLLDEVTFPLMQQLPATPASRLLIQSIKRDLAKLHAAGVRTAVTNSTYRRVLNPYAGRSHIKTAIINDDVYIGGCNLSSPGHIDMMVRFRDKHTADWLYGQMNHLQRTIHSRSAFKDNDQAFVVDAETLLLVDAGKPHQSLIYARALEMIDLAQGWIVMTCQWFPNSDTIAHLARAYRRGVDVSLYFNHPGKHRPGHNILHHLVFLHERTRQPPALFKRRLQRKTPFLHAKLLATESGAMIGSHNYIKAGVDFGTAELALYRRDAVFSRAAVEHITHEIKTKELRQKR